MARMCMSGFVVSGICCDVQSLWFIIRMVSCVCIFFSGHSSPVDGFYGCIVVRGDMLGHTLSI